ncbi:unnamed protein product [Ilex paraguariensis]|uniref:Glabrous enhancer-binding protein-like DBD domain-containing protein n=1 Tax=Ilex paraguariensis TaxID=185542 RepID=A0ABC8RCC3_9AQUA
MAQKRKSDHDPPHNSVSEEEEEEGEGSSEELEDSESESEEEKEKPTPSSPPPQITKNPSVPKKPEPLSQAPDSSSSSSDDSEQDSESDTPSEKSRNLDPKIKPIASKPMDEETKPTKKPRSKPSLPPSSPIPPKSTKRPVESEGKESKRAKQKTDVDNGDLERKNSTVTPGDDSKKQLFQRLWSEDDEIVILKGMIEYTAKKGTDPFADMNAFHEFIKKSLHVEVTKAQLSAKVRRLKKKYENNASKEKKGKKRTFSNPHEQKSYEWSKKFWGGESDSVEVNNSLKVNGSPRKNQNQRGSKALVANPKVEEKKENGVLSPDGSKDVEKMEVEHNMAPPPSVQISRSIGDQSLEEKIIKDGLELIKGPKRVELEDKWKKLHVEDVELYLKRVELICEQTKLVLEALKSGQ